MNNYSLEGTNKVVQKTREEERKSGNRDEYHFISACNICGNWTLVGGVYRK
ncbi:hypothetical protein KW850_22215 [Bacillus sp. sid0103]|uniref:hypothetical protein n=1 Tax=Bacillus sp. sid0103 TaxID=2856337 RepID=UPI001C45571B|nr:hypothetical protein [Bacillus sp. sid0103]MBV7507935.1 hypothetical protein [Bacillus sp. sid0103]